LFYSAFSGVATVGENILAEAPLLAIIMTEWLVAEGFQ
jgi:hypothetical protein